MESWQQRRLQPQQRTLVGAEQYCGYNGTGSFTQTGGTNAASGGIELGINYGGVGSYSLSGGLLSAGGVGLGDLGPGTFTQTGGTNNSGGISLGGQTTSAVGVYNLSGGLLSGGYESITDSGGGTFTQTGGTNNASSLYVQAAASGDYILSGSSVLTATTIEDIGWNVANSFIQSGGVNSITGALDVGYDFNTSGTYSLSGSGSRLSATGGENVGSLSGESTGTFTQTGGLNATSTLSIGIGSSFLLGGGTLQVTGSIINQGVFAGNGTPSALAAGGILDMTRGTWQTLQALSVSMTANSLLIVPAEFNTSTGFAHHTPWV